MRLNRLSRQTTLIGPDAQQRIVEASVDVPASLKGVSYTERYLRGAGVAEVHLVPHVAPGPDAPAFTALLDARSQELLRGSHFALSVLRRLIQERPPEG